MSELRLLAGRDRAAGAEGLDDHVRRLGPLPSSGHDLIATVERSGLLGRGGASFPVGAKWRSVAAKSRGAAVIIVNGAEGEPQSRKDRLLMSTRPHLVLDGAFLASRAVHAKQVVIYVGEEHETARASMARALSERPESEGRLARIVSAPNRYVAGTSSAAVHLVNAGIATPTTTPPHPHEREVTGAPTLVQNVETLAYVALLG